MPESIITQESINSKNAQIDAEDNSPVVVVLERSKAVDLLHSLAQALAKSLKTALVLLFVLFVFNAHAQTPASPKEEVFDQKIVDIAMSQVGTVKQVGYDSGKVKEYVETTDQNAEEYFQDGWCNGFVSWVMKKAGYEWASLNSVDQIGYFYHQVAIPKIGDVVILEGHITLYYGKADLPGFDGAILILGGNQAHAVNVLPIAESRVKGYYEPIKAPFGWTPSRHLSSDSMNSYNLLDDRGYIKDELDRAARMR